MAGVHPLLSQLIDDYIGWFVDWHRATLSSPPAPVPPPACFALWRGEAMKTLEGKQPAIERVTALHEQLHRLVKLVLLKEAEAPDTEHTDDDAITAKYLELMQELRRLERAFAMAAADLDPLTGLRTRLTMSEDLEREISRSARGKRPFFVSLMDIDHFKKVNDTYGHENGDRVLAAIADHVSRSLRAHDDAYRFGGEEFLLCLKETDAAGSLRVLERLRADLEKNPIALADGQHIPVTASFGLVSSAAATTPEALIRQADEALYRAKHEGRNRIVAIGAGEKASDAG